MTDDEIVDTINDMVYDQVFSNVIMTYDISKNIFIKCLPAINKNYRKDFLLKYANEHNKKIINEVFDKLEIFK